MFRLWSWRVESEWWVSEWVSEWVSDCEWVSEWWVSGWVSWWVSEWMSEWVSEWVNEWVSECMSEWVSEWVSEWSAHSCNFNHRTPSGQYSLSHAMITMNMREPVDYNDTHHSHTQYTNVHTPVTNVHTPVHQCTHTSTPMYTNQYSTKQVSVYQCTHSNIPMYLHHYTNVPIPVYHCTTPLCSPQSDDTKPFSRSRWQCVAVVPVLLCKSHYHHIPMRRNKDFISVPSQSTHTQTI